MENNDIDAFDEEVENLEAEEKEIIEGETKKIRKGKTGKKVEAEVPTEKYVAVHQREIIGIADTVTGELLVEGLPNLAFAQLEAIKLNKLDKMEVATGVNN